MDAIDQMTGETLARGNPALFWLYAYLSASFRAGHMFVEISEAFVPSPQELFEEESNPEEIDRAIRAGFQQFQTNSFVIRIDNRIYLKRAYECEKRLLEELKRLTSICSPAVTIDEKYRALLSDEQLSAVSLAFCHPLFCIAGGPGTGKTHTAGLFLKMFLEKSERSICRVALLGPTGKAAANLERSIVRAAGTLPHVETKTLHALLRQSKEMLNYHFIIVDESSMVDAELLVEFLSRVGPYTKVLFLGDPDQLPSVEAGESFCTLLERLPHARLTRSQRTDQTAILTLARLVNEGDAEGALNFLKQNQSVVSFKEASFEEPLPALSILSPKKAGPWGVEAVNSYFLLQKPTTYPILITKNDYELGLMNGEIGRIEGSYALFQERKIPAILLSHFEPAFCISVHKSQGSEFDNVLLLLPPGSELFSRRMLYTAITRAKKSITIWGSEETLRATIENHGKRLFSSRVDS